MKIILLVSLFCCSQVLIAKSIPPGQWQCMAFDFKKNQFDAIGFSLPAAMTLAKSTCKKNSTQPASCQSAQSFCEQGPLSLNEPRCLVTDNAGHSWDTTGPDACKTAMSMCDNFLYLQAGPRGQCSVKHGG